MLTFLAAIFANCSLLTLTDSSAGSNKECFVPLVKDQKANMQLLHLGRSHAA